MPAFPSASPSVEGGFSALRSIQCDVLTRQQAAAIFGLGYVRWAVADGRWQMASRDVVVLHNSRLDRSQAVWAQLLAAPPRSCIGGLTALELDGFAGFYDDRIHLVMPQGQRRPRLPLAATHWSSHLGDADVHPLRQPRRTRPARSLLDAATWSGTDARARVLLLAGVQQRLVTPNQLSDALSRRGPCPKRAVITETILDAEGGVQSLPEREFGLIIRSFRLPEPSRQLVCRRRDGRYFLDVDWQRYGVAAEVEGRHHFEVLSWDGDLDRHNEITAEGRRLLHFTSFTIRHRQDRVGDILTRALFGPGSRR